MEINQFKSWIETEGLVCGGVGGMVAMAGMACVWEGGSGLGLQTLQPMELAELIHRLFSEFDRAVRDFGLFKVVACDILVEVVSSENTCMPGPNKY